MTSGELHSRASDPVKAVLGITFKAAEIPLNGINANTANHRADDPANAQADEELTRSVREVGMLQPILVWETADGRFDLVAGNRRVRCARRAGMSTVPARILSRKPTPHELDLLNLVENLQRVDISDIDLGLACLNFTAAGKTWTEIAEMLNKHVSTVTRASGLVRKIPGDLHDAIRRGKLPPSVARELTLLPDDDVKRDIARRYMDGKLKTRNEVVAAVRAVRNGNGTGKAPTSFTCEVGGTRVRVDLAAGQGMAEALAAVKELHKDLQQHRRRSVADFLNFLAAKAEAAMKADALKEAEATLAQHRPESPSQNSPAEPNPTT